MPSPLKLEWKWDLACSVEDIWPLLADTNQFNQDLGLEKVEKESRIDPIRSKLRTLVAGVETTWTEQPFEWTLNKSFTVTRIYDKGPMKKLRVDALFEPTPSGSRFTYRYEINPRNLLWKLLLLIGFRTKFTHDLNRLVRHYEKSAKKKQTPTSFQKTQFVVGGKERLQTLAETLSKKGLCKEATSGLREFIESGDALSLSRMRPAELARTWNTDRGDTIDLFLESCRAGLLEFRWEILCPHCRGSEQKLQSLEDVSTKSACSSCNIDYEVGFDQSVELTFRPNPSIRKIEESEFCVGGPGVTPHIISQKILKPGESTTLKPSLPEGSYRIRSQGMKGSQLIQVTPNNSTQNCEIPIPESNQWSKDKILLSPGAEITASNPTQNERIWILERTAWNDDALMARDVFSIQKFRDLFSTEALRPDQPVSLGSLTIVFTDLKGSTKMYRETGDAKAFGLVMDHFKILKHAIEKYDGAIIKNIGDAIMASFSRPVCAVKAMLLAQENLKKGNPPLKLKAGAHFGPCLAVRFNGRLDYFGTTINLGSRLEGQSTSEDVIITEAVYSDPEVKAALQNQEFNASETESQLKGFDQEAFRLFRVSAS